MTVVSVTAANDAPGPITRYVSDASGLRFHEAEHKIQWTKEEENSNEVSAGNVIEVLPDQKLQQFDGLGGSFMRGGAQVLNAMPETVQHDILTDLFDQHKGAAFAIGKVPIGACDFGVPTWYTYADTPQEEDLPLFSLQHDIINDDGSNAAYIPYVQAAQRVAGRPLRLEATLDYLPQWMLNSTVGLPAAELNTTLYSAIANYYYKYATHMAAHGVPVEFMSLFNELTDSYMNASYENTRTLLVDYVAPLFKKQAAMAAGDSTVPPPPKLTWTEKFGRRVTQDSSPSFYEMEGVQDATDVVFYHGYDCNYGPAEDMGWQCSFTEGPAESNALNTTCPYLQSSAEAMAQFYADYGRNRTVWMSEVCYASEFGDYNTSSSGCPPLPRPDFDDAMQWGDMLFADFNTVGANGWIYWNLILDPSGGPWLNSPEHNDPDPNEQQPVVIADPATGTYQLTGVYYAMAHFSKFIPTGSSRRIAMATPDGATYPTLQYSAFVTEQDEGATVTVVLMNRDYQPRSVTLQVAGFRSAPMDVPPIAFVTMQFRL